MEDAIRFSLHAAEPEAALGRPARWGAVYAMSLCVFALIASEFMPVSLLTPMAAALGVSEGLAGRGIAISGAFAVLASLGTSTIAARVERRTLLLALTASMCASGAIVGLAPNYATYMAGRALIGVVIGGFWSLSAATAMQLVPADRVPRALAIFNGGNALATVVAAPLGSVLGATVGWRGAFLCLVPIAIGAFAWQARSLPAMGRMPGDDGGFRLLKRRPVRLGLLAAGGFFMGQFALYTYLRPFLETVTRVDAGTLSWVLLIVGVAGFVGTSLVGRVLALGLHATLTVIPIVMAGVSVALVVFGASLTVVALLLAVWGLVATAAPVGWWTWIARTLPHDAEAGGGMMVAAVQLSIGLGASVGGLLYDGLGWRATFGFSAALLLAAAALVHLAGRATSASSDTRLP